MTTLLNEFGSISKNESTLNLILKKNCNDLFVKSEYDDHPGDIRAQQIYHFFKTEVTFSKKKLSKFRLLAKFRNEKY